MIELFDAKESPRHRLWLGNVFPLYLHELSEFDGEYELNAEGRYEPDYLPYWLEEPDANPLVMEDKDRCVGFAMVGTREFPYKNPGVDHRMSEFFVTRVARGLGVAERCAIAVFDRFPGSWEITELSPNERALRFWRRVVERYSGGTYSETTEGREIRQIFRTSHR